MASSGLLDRMSCGVCMEAFDDKAHVPQLLPCQHTFCLSCLTSMDKASIAETRITCPVCRSKHAIPRRGFTTNRAVLDIVEEIQNQSALQAPSLTCTKHGKKECVLVCIDCVEGLCAKCVKRNHHQGHNLEDLSEARILLQEKLKEQNKKIQFLFERQMSVIKKSLYSVSEITQAETEIRAFRETLVKEIFKWENEQLAALGDLKKEINIKERDLQKEIDSLDKHANDLATVIVKLKFKNSTNVSQIFQSPGLEKYKFDERRQALARRVHQVINGNDFSNKILKQQHILRRKQTAEKSLQVDFDLTNTKSSGVQCTTSDAKRETVSDTKVSNTSSVPAREICNVSLYEIFCVTLYISLGVAQCCLLALGTENKGERNFVACSIFLPFFFHYIAYAIISCIRSVQGIMFGCLFCFVYTVLCSSALWGIWHNRELFATFTVVLSVTNVMMYYILAYLYVVDVLRSLQVESSSLVKRTRLKIQVEASHWMNLEWFGC